MDKTAFLKSVLPYYKQAEQQEDLHRFLDILVPIWINRYPVEEYYPIICNNPLLREEAIAEIREVCLPTIFKYYVHVIICRHLDQD
jgi:hypothetical protein